MIQKEGEERRLENIQKQEQQSDLTLLQLSFLPDLPPSPETRSNMSYSVSETRSNMSSSVSETDKDLMELQRRLKALQNDNTTRESLKKLEQELPSSFSNLQISSSNLLKRVSVPS